MAGQKRIEGYHRVFYKTLEVEDEKAKDAKKTAPLLDYFGGFPAVDIEGIPPYVPPTVEEAPWTRPKTISLIMQNCGVTFRTGDVRAFYAPQLDLIQLPPDVAFPRPEYRAAPPFTKLITAPGTLRERIAL